MATIEKGHIFLALAILGAVLSGCSSIKTVKVEPGFNLNKISGQYIAMSSVGEIVMNNSASMAALEKFGTQEAFSIAFSTRLSQKCIQALGAAPSFDSAQLADLLKRPGEQTGFGFAVLSERGITNVGRRFSEIETLNNVRFLIVPWRLVLHRAFSPAVGGAYAIPLPHFEISAQLFIAILDLQSKQMVWSGFVLDRVWSTLDPGEAMMELADSLGEKIAASAL